MASELATTRFSLALEPKRGMRERSSRQDTFPISRTTGTELLSDMEVAAG